MSLQVWLPLNGDFKNQGIYGDINFTATGTISDVDGKIGMCKSFSSSNVIAPYTYTLGSSFSVCLWVNWITFPASNSNDWIIHLGKTSGYANAVVGLSCYHSTLITVMAGGKNDSTYTHGFTTGTWHHLAFTWRSSGSSYLYVDGELVKTYTNLTGGTVTAADKISLGSNVANSATKLQGKLNDVRFYDHFLSAEEIKEISRGLILHYPLDRNNLSPYTGNLILNAFGELGTKNWGTPANIYTDDLPTDDSTIKARFYNNTSQEYIPIYRGHTYNFSTWVKASQTTGSTYPSFVPYDVDKNRINYYHSKAGFNLNTMTTLTQQLKSGDTKIYVNDLSAWNANSGNNYNYAAIFYYTDGTGYRWPAGTYTRIVPAYGSGTNAKTNLDKTNNIITLNSAYSGITIPVGTSVCSSTAGSTYFYPLGAIANSGIADWTQKNGNFSGDHNYLSAACYLRYYSYSNGYAAGMVLKDITPGDSNLEYDTSGYQRNGTRNENLPWTTDSSRYKASTAFNGVNYIQDLPVVMSSAALTSKLTISAWIYRSSTEAVARRIYRGIMDVYLHTDFSIRIQWNHVNADLSYNTTNTWAPGNAIPLNTWTFIAFTFEDGVLKYYINGEQKGTSDRSANGQFIKGYRGNQIGNLFIGNISDIRVYATALSAQDIQDLYNGLF